MTIEERQEAAKWFQNRASHTSMPGAKMMFKRAAEALSEGMQPQWIPCSERLPEHPENDDYYLVTIQCEHYDGWDDYVTGFAEWTKHGWDELSCYIGQIKVIAWMPLPKPYDGGDAK